MSSNKKYNNKYVLVRATKSNSPQLKPKQIINIDNEHPTVWYLVKEKKVNLYKDWGIRIIN